MKKLLSYIIVFIMLISFNLLDVRAKSFDCDCSSALYHDYREENFDFRFHVDEKKLNDIPFFWINVNGRTLENQQFMDEDTYQEFRLQNYNRIYGDDNDYTFIDEYINKGTCPSYVILLRDGYMDRDYNLSFSDKMDIYDGQYYHVYAADEESRDIIAKYVRKKYTVTESLFGSKVSYYGQTWIGKCKMVNVKEDVVSNSNEPSNEPTDPNSNIPTVNSNKTLNEDNTIYFCGSDKVDTAVMRNIPADVPRIIRFLYIFLQVLVPIGIVVVSSIDLFKAISAQKEDDIKKGQQTLIKRIIAAVIIFFVFAIVKLVLSVISDNSDSIIDCISCFLENSDEYCIKHVQ